MKNGLTTSLLFFFLLENAKNLDILNCASKILQKFEWLDEAKRKKKEREDASGLIKQVS